MTAYRLIDIVTNPITLTVWIKSTSGKAVKRVRLVPNRLYHDFIGDPVFEESIRNATTTVNWTKALEKACKDAGVRYELPKRTCSCQSQKIRIWCVEVVE